MPQDKNEVEILEKDLLWRRVLDNPRWWTETPDGVVRPSSSSFLLRKLDGELEDGLSVQLERLSNLEKASSVIESAGIAEIEVAFPRSLNLEVVHNPIEEDIAHSLIRPKEGKKITKSQARKMAGKAKMIVLPESKR